MTQTIEIVVAPDGQAHVETKGFTGRSCQDASRFVEQALGKCLKESLTTEFYVTAEAQASLQQQQS